MVINATSTSGATGSAYGIYANDTTSSNAITSFNAIQRTTINVLSNTNGVCRGVYNGGSSYFSVRDSTIFCGVTGTAAGNNFIGVENNGPTGFTSIKTSTISGATNDILRTSGSLLLNATDLTNSTSNIQSFTVGTTTQAIYFGMYTTTANYGAAETYYLAQGSINSSILSHTTQVRVYFPKNIVVYAFACSVSTPASLVGTATFNFYNNGTLITGASMILSSGTFHLTVTNVSATILTTQYLSASCVLSNNNVSNACIFNCSVSVY